MGLTVLRRTLPITIDVQQCLFDEEERPGGSLLAALLRLERLNFGFGGSKTPANLRVTFSGEP